VLSAADLHDRASREINAGRLGRARRLLEAALQRGPSDDTSARIELSLAYLESETGRVDDGLRRCARALDLPQVSPVVRGRVYSQSGLLLMRAGRTDEALEAYARALPLLGAATEAVVRAHLNRGNAYLQREDWPRARDSFEESRRLAAERGLDVMAAKAEHNLGYVLFRLGDLIAGLRTMEHSRAVLAPLSPVSQAFGDQDRAELLMAAGLTSDAIAALKSAVTTFGARRIRQPQAEAELLLASLLRIEGDPRAARVLARRAARRFRNRGSEAWALRADLAGLRAEVTDPSARSVEPRVGLDLAEKLDAIGIRNEATVSRLTAAHAAIRCGEVGLAADLLRRTRSTRVAPTTTHLLQHEVRAELAAARGRPTRALGHVRRGLDQLHEWQSTFGSLDLQSSVVGHGRALALRGLSLAVTDGRPEVVFEWSERARALASRVIPLGLGQDDEARAELAQLRRLQSELDGRPPRPGLVTDLRRLRGRIRQHAWYQAGAGQVTDPLPLDEVRAVLAPVGGALVAYVYADGEIHALVLTGRSAEVRYLVSHAAVRRLTEGLQADMDMAAGTLPVQLRTVVLDSLRHRLRGIADVLVDPIADLVGDGPVAVVPAGALAGVPWTLLPGYDTRPLTVPRSASLWVTTRAGSVAARTAGFVAGPRVARADEEVHASAAQWASAEVLRGDEATSGRVSALAGRVDVLHAATHGRHSADNALFSGIELADGPWFGYDVAQLDRIPSTVILSACELGRSTVRWGEETIGMTVAWLHAGARCVIASPALVNDDIACEVLTATHRGLVTGERPAYALSTATTEVLGTATHRAPVPFSCFGAGW
jgi:tetratricopeptide (TPR) repeat protein